MKTETHTHTKGPWIATPALDNGKTRSTFYIGPSQGAPDSISPVGSISNSRAGMSVEECEINARLCAAAPELLEALKWATERVAGRGSYEDYMKCQRIIAKAEGRDDQ